MNRDERIAGSAEERIKELEKLAYIGEHHFPDLTWKARCDEVVAELRALQSTVATHTCWTGNPCGTDTVEVGAECPVLGKCFWKLHDKRSAIATKGEKP